MNGVQFAHPASDQLASFGLGKLNEADSTRVEEHLADCESCRLQVEGSPDDGFVALIQVACRPSVSFATPESQAGDTGLSPGQAPAAAPPGRPASPQKSGGSLPPLYKRLAAILHPEEGPSQQPDQARAQPEPRGPALPELAQHPRYEVLERLGAGGMGTVYKAKHRLMDRLVALKVLDRRILDWHGAVDRFRREARAAAQLAHPNIVAAYDAESVGDMHFLVMEFVDGENLADLVLRQGPLPTARACDYVRQVALGLDHAHQRGMVHRDIKPHNLILTPQGQVKILDFGLARFVSESSPAAGGTEAGIVMGSPDYLAPEQARDAHRADIRADIYALGCTLYHLLVGQVPFPGGSAVDKVSAHLNRRPPALAGVGRGVPPALAQVVERMMAKDPGDRYQTPAEVAEALAPFCEVSPPATMHSPATPSSATPPAPRPPTPASRPPTPAPRPERRRPHRLMAAAALAALGVLGVLFGAPVMRFATNRGVVVVETDDPDVEVTVKQGGQQVQIIDTKTRREVTLQAGEYQLELTGGKEGLKLSTNQFTLSRGGTQILKVSLEPAEAKPPVAQREKPQPPTAIVARIDEPPSLKEYLKGREVLTVAQDGSGMFKTIGDAVAALKPRQVVEILDKGPYRERLDASLPEDVGIVSEVGTRIEVPDWKRGSPLNDGKINAYYGWFLQCPRSLRLSGLEIVCPKLEADAGYSSPIYITTDGDFTMDFCRVFHNPRYPLAPPTQADLAPGEFRAEIRAWTGGKQSRICLQENHLQCSVTFWSPGATILIRRNRFLCWRFVGIGFWGSAEPRSVAVQQNIIRGKGGIYFDGRGAGPEQWGDTPVSITNNVFEVVTHPIQVLFEGEGDRRWCPRKLRIQDNIIHSEKGGGIALSAKCLAEVRDSWQVGHNCYLDEPGGIENTRSFPKQATDLVQQPHFLSPDPKDADYMRIAADSLLATAGAGGDLPKYIGALPPGPAPKEGDWFTRLQQQVQEASVVEPLPLVEWLKGREVLTVAQDGSGQFKTIAAAVGALKPKQAVKILDRGPYRENIDATLPEDVGIISEVGTRIELPGWRKERPIGWSLVGLRGLRLSGLEFACPKAAPNALAALPLAMWVDGDVILESLRVLRNPRGATPPPGPVDPASDFRVDVYNWASAGEHARVWVEGNYLESHLVVVRPDATILIRRNYIGNGLSLRSAEKPRQVFIRENIIHGDCGIMSIDEGTEPRQPAHPPVSITNNVLEAVGKPICFNPGNESRYGLYPRNVRIQNNIFRSARGGGIALSAKALMEVEGAWQVGHNCYQDAPGGIDGLRAFPQRPTDLIQRSPFLGANLGDADYARIPADSPLATAGAGGDLPKYIGPLPPGPAPKEGDWFTRLQQEVQEASVFEPLSLAEWLKGREVLTVAQDGRGQFKTIAAAIDALKPGQVVRVLDRGPYRERFAKVVPSDVGIVSEAGTRIELPDWHRRGAEGKEGGDDYEAIVLCCPQGIRLSGIEFVCPRFPPNAKLAMALVLQTAGRTTVDSCRVLQTPRSRIEKPEPGACAFRAISFHGLPEGQNRSAWLVVEGNHFEGIVQCDRQPAPAERMLFQHNHFVGGSWYPLALVPALPRELVIRHNVFHTFHAVQFFVQAESVPQEAQGRYTIVNNYFETVDCPITVRHFPPERTSTFPIPRDVRIQNNVFRLREGIGHHLGIRLENEGELAAAKASWQVGHNCYLREPQGGPGQHAFPRQATDRVEAPAMLSTNPDHTNFLRIAADSPLATAGAGGELPRYIGALPPGPAPKEGDWFTRLQQQDRKGD